MKPRHDLFAEESQCSHYLRVRNEAAAIDLRQYAVDAELVLQRTQALRHHLRRADQDLATERLKRIENLTYDEALGGQVLVGTPQMVTDRLGALQDELGIDGILAEINCGGLIPHEQVMTALRLLCEEVKPRFH